jgi:hypothetical protein
MTYVIQPTAEAGAQIVTCCSGSEHASVLIGLVKKYKTEVRGKEVEEVNEKEEEEKRHAEEDEKQKRVTKHNFVSFVCTYYSANHHCTHLTSSSDG